MQVHWAIKYHHTIPWNVCSEKYQQTLFFCNISILHHVDIFKRIRKSLSTSTFQRITAERLLYLYCNTNRHREIDQGGQWGCEKKHEQSHVFGTIFPARKILSMVSGGTSAVYETHLKLMLLNPHSLDLTHTHTKRSSVSGRCEIEHASTGITFVWNHDRENVLYVYLFQRIRKTAGGVHIEKQTKTQLVMPSCYLQLQWSGVWWFVGFSVGQVQLIQDKSSHSKTLYTVATDNYWPLPCFPV